MKPYKGIPEKIFRSAWTEIYAKGSSGGIIGEYFSDIVQEILARILFLR